MAIAFRHEGQSIKIGPRSGQRYANNIGENGFDTVIVTTKSGNAYGVGRGRIVNARTGEVSMLGRESLDVMVGESLALPDGAYTSDVEGVFIKHKDAAPGSDMAQEQRDKPSPFRALEADLENIIQQSYED